jgi:hypothetical protein
MEENLAADKLVEEFTGTKTCGEMILTCFDLTGRPFDSGQPLKSPTTSDESLGLKHAAQCGEARSWGNRHHDICWSRTGWSVEEVKRVGG